MDKFEGGRNIEILCQAIENHSSYDNQRPFLQQLFSTEGIKQRHMKPKSRSGF
jgi:hypothetical protein